MGLKDLKSILDLVEGENTPVGNMENQMGPQFQLPSEIASQKHIDSLQEIPNQSPFQDLNGEQGPQSQLSITDASQTHIDSLQELPNQSPFQDLNGVPDLNYNTLNGTSDSPFIPKGQGTGDHMVDLLTNSVTSVNSGESYSPSTQDLNGAGTLGTSTFDNGTNSPLHTDSLASIYQSSINQGASYMGNWPNIAAGTYDLNGGLPSNGVYTNPDTGNSF